MSAKVNTSESAKSKTTVPQKTTLHVSQEQYLLRKVFHKTSDLSELCSWLSIPLEDRNSAVSAADYYNQSTKPRKVRKLIYELDYIGDTALADSVMDYAEQPDDLSITPKNIKEIFQALSLTGLWEKIGIIPPERAKALCQKFTIWRQPAEAAKYYALYHENPTWKDLSRRLYRMREKDALNIAKTYIQTVKDQTLTPANSLKATQEIPVWEADHSYNCLDMAESVHEEITNKYSGEQAKLELFTEWITGHPFPCWEDVRELLRRLEEWKVGKMGAAEIVEETYIKGPQLIPAQQYSHQLVDGQFPGICFLGDPDVVAVQSKAVTISPPGHGIILKIPPNATQSTSSPVNISVRACLSSSVFEFPENFTLLSAVYLISSDSAFDEDVEMMFEHFAELETEQQTKAMKVFRADFQGSKKYKFTPIKGGEFKEYHSFISTKQFGFVCAGSMLPEIWKRYTVLCSHSNQVEAERHVGVAISLDHAVYITNFRKALEEEWKVSLSHRYKLDVFFNERNAYVDYNQSNPKEWIVKSQRRTLTQEYVDQPYLAEYDYPPRVILDVTQLEGAGEISTLNITVSGMSEKIQFQVPLKALNIIQVPNEIDQEHTKVSTDHEKNTQPSNDLGQDAQPLNDLGQAAQPSNQAAQPSGKNTQSSNDPGQNTQPSNQKTDVPGWNTQPSTDLEQTDQPPSSINLKKTAQSSNSPGQICSQLSIGIGQTTEKVKLEKPNLITLSNLKTSRGDLKIIQRSAIYYEKIGIFLLNDRHGHRVDVIAHDKMRQANAIMLTVYKEWINEDPNCSWTTLTDCFRQCELTSLALSIEKHFELPSPPQNPQAIEETESDEENLPSDSKVDEISTGTDSDLEESITASESEEAIEPVVYNNNSVRSSVTEAVRYLFSRGTLCPDLQNLKEFTKQDGNKINILQEIHDAERFGRILLDDKDGMVIEVIKNENDNYIEMIIHLWLHCMGKRPTTWKTLARVIMKLGLIDLAKDIQHGPAMIISEETGTHKGLGVIGEGPEISKEPGTGEGPGTSSEGPGIGGPGMGEEHKKGLSVKNPGPVTELIKTISQVESESYWSEMDLFLMVAIPTSSILLFWLCKKCI